MIYFMRESYFGVVEFYPPRKSYIFGFNAMIFYRFYFGMFGFYQPRKRHFLSCTSFFLRSLALGCLSFIPPTKTYILGFTTRTFILPEWYFGALWIFIPKRFHILGCTTIFLPGCLSFCGTWFIHPRNSIFSAFLR